MQKDKAYVHLNGLHICQFIVINIQDNWVLLTFRHVRSKYIKVSIRRTLKTDVCEIRWFRRLNYWELIRSEVELGDTKLINSGN